jgi:PAS domain S-box-containing protein
VLRGQHAAAALDDHVLSPEQTQELLHDLHVHQIELEMQNVELRRVQTELELERERYFDLYEMAPVGYCTLSAKGLILDANLTAANLLGRSRQQVLKQRFSQFIEPRHQDSYYLHRKQLLASRQTQSFELQMVAGQAQSFWARIITSVVHKYDGDEIRIVLSDITERKLSEEQIGEQRRFLDTVNDNVQANIYIKDENGRYLYVNQAVATVFGRPIADILGKSDIEIHPPQTARQLMEFDSEVRVSGVRHATEEMVPDDSGTPRYYWSVKMPIAVRNHPHALIGFSTDITERKVAEEAQRIASTAFESQQGTFITDANKVILRVNKAFTSVTGYTLQEAVGQTPA